MSNSVTLPDFHGRRIGVSDGRKLASEQSNDLSDGCKAIFVPRSSRYRYTDIKYKLILLHAKRKVG